MDLLILTHPYILEKQSVFKYIYIASVWFIDYWSHTSIHYCWFINIQLLLYMNCEFQLFLLLSIIWIKIFCIFLLLEHIKLSSFTYDIPTKVTSIVKLVEMLRFTLLHFEPKFPWDKFSVAANIIDFIFFIVWNNNTSFDKRLSSLFDTEILLYLQWWLYWMLQWYELHCCDRSYIRVLMWSVWV